MAGAQRLHGRLRRDGFELLDTPPEDHFDVVLPDVERETVERLRACFERQDNPARPRREAR